MTGFMDALLDPALLVMLAIAWICIEAIFSYVLYRRRSRPAWARWSVANAASGLMLLLSVFLALAGADHRVFALCLSGALVAHLTELALRPKQDS